jgi:hypothetical protein
VRLFVTANTCPVGGQVELRGGLARAARPGQRVTVFARTARPGLPHLQTVTESVAGVEVVRLANTFEDATRFERMLSHPGIDEVFEHALSRLRPDVVHIHHLTCLSTTIVERCKRRGLPVVMTLHDFWMGCPRGQPLGGLDLCPIGWAVPAT